MPIAVIIATIFIGLYFYRSANNIGKNGLLWVGIALGTFITLSVLASLVFYFLFVYLLGYSQGSSFFLGGFVGLGAGITGLLVVNRYLNIIPD
jgi:hypothetical protein